MSPKIHFKKISFYNIGGSKKNRFGFSVEQKSVDPKA